MLVAALLLLAAALVLAMMTMGAVLAVRLTLGGAQPSRRILFAALGGPFALGAPLFLVASASEGRFVAEMAVGFLVVVLGGALVVGWPVAVAATRRLDRLTAFDPAIFE